MKQKSIYQRRKEKRFRNVIKDVRRCINQLRGLAVRVRKLDGPRWGAVPDESFDLTCAATCLGDAEMCAKAALNALKTLRAWDRDHAQEA